jgi:hypothetical protein
MAKKSCGGQVRRTGLGVDFFDVSSALNIVETAAHVDKPPYGVPRRYAMDGALSDT